MRGNSPEDFHGGIPQKIGLILIGVFFLISTVMVIRNHSGSGRVFADDTKVLTFAHWQLEDGFREGFAEAIAEYEKLQAAKGVKVKVNQVAVPIRGYSQWMLTQLIGGDPADVIELISSSDILNQYFTALSPYIGQPNPYNAGTPLEGRSWRETFVDDMVGALDPVYSEFFGVCFFMHTTRVYVNMELYENATGKTSLPATLSEWLEDCQKLVQYGKENGRPVIPIGVRGFDKGTLGQLFDIYNSQMNSDFNDFGNAAGYGVSSGYLFRLVNQGKLPLRRLLAPVNLVTEIGRYFADGFTAIDLEQTKYLFFSGNVGFFIDGTWNAHSMVQNSPFPVNIMRIPVLDRQHPLGKNSFGAISELGSGIGGKFGIPKKTRNFDLALDFLQFVTSWKINQMTMVKHCKWMSSLKGVAYDGLMKDFTPVTDTQYAPLGNFFVTGAYARRKMLQRLEQAIIEHPADPGKFFWEDFLKDRPMILDEIAEADLGTRRSIWNLDATRSTLTLSAWRDTISPKEAALLRFRRDVNLEGTVSRLRALDNSELLLRELPKLKSEVPDHGN